MLNYNELALGVAANLVGFPLMEVPGKETLLVLAQDDNGDVYVTQQGRMKRKPRT